MGFVRKQQGDSAHDTESLAEFFLIKLIEIFPIYSEIAHYAEKRRRHLNFNAQVHENGVSILHWQHPDTAEPYRAICGFDVNLLGGIGQFISGGKTYQLSFTPPSVTPIIIHSRSSNGIGFPPLKPVTTKSFRVISRPHHKLHSGETSSQNIVLESP